MAAPLLVAAQLLWMPLSARAADSDDPPSQAQTAPAQNSAGSSQNESGDEGVEPPQKKKTSKGRRGGDRKETEGTTAPNRFEADTVIKSQYKLDGEPLEVDPD